MLQNYAMQNRTIQVEYRKFPSSYRTKKFAEKVIESLENEGDENLEENSLEPKMVNIV